MNASLDNDMGCDKSISKENNNLSLETGEGYVIFIRESAGTATVAPDNGDKRRVVSPRSEPRAVRLPQTVSSAGRQARARLRNHAVANGLGACVTLTYRELPTDPAKDLSKYIRDVRHLYSDPMHWASVTEGTEEGSEHRPHHHVLLPLCSNLHKVASQWTHGDIHVGINVNDASIRCAVNYLSKEFDRESGQGPRFRSSRGGRPNRVVIHAGSLEEATSAALSYVPAEIDTYTSNFPGIEGRVTFYWETGLSAFDLSPE
jgi:hypothetical protein